MAYQPTGDYVLDLNNYLQPSGNTRYLSWEYAQSGPGNQITHFAIVNYQGQPIGQGSATSRSHARQAAAYHGLRSFGVLP